LGDFLDEVNGVGDRNMKLTCHPRRKSEKRKV
jgi:hypothetical protein